MKTPLEAAMNPQKKNTVTSVAKAELLFFIGNEFNQIIKNTICI